MNSFMHEHPEAAPFKVFNSIFNEDTNISLTDLECICDEASCSSSAQLETVTLKEQSNNESHDPHANTTEGRYVNQSDPQKVLDIANSSLLTLYWYTRLTCTLRNHSECRAALINYGK